MHCPTISVLPWRTSSSQGPGDLVETSHPAGHALPAIQQGRAPDAEDPQRGSLLTGEDQVNSPVSHSSVYGFFLLTLSCGHFYAICIFWNLVQMLSGLIVWLYHVNGVSKTQHCAG